jgi:hypothetical protein
LDTPETSNGLQPNSKKIQKKKSFPFTKQKHSSDPGQMSLDETSSAKIILAEHQNQMGFGGKKGVGFSLPVSAKEDIICKIIKKLYGKRFANAGNEKIIELLKEPRIIKDAPICKDFVLSDLEKTDSGFNDAIKEVIFGDKNFEVSTDELRDFRRDIRRWIESLGKIDGRGQPRIPKDKRENFRLFIISILLKQPSISKNDLLGEIAKIAKQFYKDANEQKICKDHWWQLCIEKDSIIKKVWDAVCEIKKMKMNVNNSLICDALYQSSLESLMANNDAKSLEQLSGNLSSDSSHVERNLDGIETETTSISFNDEGEKAIVQEEDKAQEFKDNIAKNLQQSLDILQVLKTGLATQSLTPQFLHFPAGSPTSSIFPPNMMLNEK